MICVTITAPISPGSRVTRPVRMLAKPGAHIFDCDSLEKQSRMNTGFRRVCIISRDVSALQEAIIEETAPNRKKHWRLQYNIELFLGPRRSAPRSCGATRSVEWLATASPGSDTKHHRARPNVCVQNFCEQVRELIQAGSADVGFKLNRVTESN